MAIRQHAAGSMWRAEEDDSGRPGVAGRFIVWFQWIRVSIGAGLSRVPDERESSRSFGRTLRKVGGSHGDEAGEDRED
jgi:hypothetical protein